MFCDNAVKVSNWNFWTLFSCIFLNMIKEKFCSKKISELWFKKHYCHLQLETQTSFNSRMNDFFFSIFLLWILFFFFSRIWQLAWKFTCFGGIEHNLIIGNSPFICVPHKFCWQFDSRFSALNFHKNFHFMPPLRTLIYKKLKKKKEKKDWRCDFLIYKFSK